jgi:hypothetical protein
MNIQPEQYKREDLMQFRTKILHDMMHLPGVLCVSIGLKEVAGEYTSQLCFKIYVKEKRCISQLQPEQIIPAKYEGYLTDVVVMKTLLKAA